MSTSYMPSTVLCALPICPILSTLLLISKGLLLLCCCSSGIIFWGSLKFCVESVLHQNLWCGIKSVGFAVRTGSES